MNNANHTNGNAQTNLGFVFTVGLLAGYVASLIIPDKAQEKAKEQFGDSVQKLKNTVADSVSGAVEDAPDLMGLYMDTREQIMDELAETQETWENIDKKKYGNVVKKALDRLVEDQKIPTKQLKTLQKYLENDYQTFRSKKTA